MALRIGGPALSAVLMGGFGRPGLADGLEWEWQNPLPQHNRVQSFWATSPNDVVVIHLPPTKGLCRLSLPIVVVGPWPV